MGSPRPRGPDVLHAANVRTALSLAILYSLVFSHEVPAHSPGTGTGPAAPQALAPGLFLTRPHEDNQIHLFVSDRGALTPPPDGTDAITYKGGAFMYSGGLM